MKLNTVCSNSLNSTGFWHGELIFKCAECKSTTKYGLEWL